MKNKLGFTLIELIIVIAVIALLAATTFVAVDPAKRIGMARDAQRWQDVTAIADAIQQYIADNNGTFPSSTDSLITAGNYFYLMGIGTSNGAGFDGDLCQNHTDVEPGFGVLLSNLVPTYLPTMPVDPIGTQNSGVTIGYYFMKSSAGRVTIGVCEESDYATASIHVQR
ncbi:MAG: hypothetical protein UR94_C0034G0004 [Parcubacteria group bacterium GW2011_GWA2_36_10]|nr:MAG: hypothetical protein UR94_C0034G0004 [Parcubacteria group bacterium GW2011_GWA2_36_10]